VTVRFHPHAAERMRERGATRAEVIEAINTGRASAAKFGRRRFRKVFAFDASRNGIHYARKQVDAFVVRMPYGWFVITIIVKYF
jgi:hypothetical protein